MQITMVGSGYVGLVSGVCLAEIGHEVTCVDIDKVKIDKLREGISPIYEPGIEKLIRQNQEHERLFFTTDLAGALKTSEVVFIAVGTPPGEDGAADLQYVMEVADSIGRLAEKDLLIIVKSTVPVGSCEKVEGAIQKQLRSRGVPHRLIVASNPEFLKEGTAIADFMKPDRIVVGLKHNEGAQEVRRLYRPFTVDDPSRLLLVDRRASEMTKYTANAMLATRISFMNELSILCEKMGVNIDQVRLGVGMDPRIGKKFLYAGPGYGGSCFPKDIRALMSFAREYDFELKLIQAAQEVNEQQKMFAANKVRSYFKNLEGKTVAIWGLAFKPGTDDVREAPAKTIIQDLITHGAKIAVHDPQAMERFRHEFGNHERIQFARNAYQALEGADALVLLTEWSEYRWPNWEKVGQLMKQRVVFDLRNQYEPQTLIQLGFHYQCIGRPDSTYHS
ncbi:MAG: UDP-glucose/GDP-mannose dehydrogenase family protein [Deltaproteobacteria bacterium]|nr:UDP-glucose/GDP-mannose dehydrogenase family protein [Deltaproteobacteria bacterium]